MGTQYIHELGPIIVTNNGGTVTVTTSLRGRLGSTIDTIDAGFASSANARDYDAFGAARNGDMSARPNGTLNLNDTIHGFTKHEHADDVWLIHMGGRIYDYQLGRFLNVDPIIQNPLSSQGLNPYSYIGNNPLSGTDPTGYASTEGMECTGSRVEHGSCGGPGFNSIQVGSPSVSEASAAQTSGNGASPGQGADSTQTQHVTNGSDAGNINTDTSARVSGSTGKPESNGGSKPQTSDYGSITGLPPSWHEQMQAIAGQSWAMNPLGAVGTNILDTILTDAFQIYGAASNSHYNAYTGMSVSGVYPGLTAAAGLGMAVVGGGESAIGKEAAEAGAQAIRGAENRLTYLYQKVGSEGEHLKFGITNNPATRYTQEQLGGGRLKILTSGSRPDMLQLERNLHETLHIGPEERQSFYIQKQVDKGLNPPPYEQ